ncbi:hypothetical protein Ae406Ps2_4129 [Pseudonocardia sp. Ae406_Ps2]|uniref:hypothetical protein n=1 Tax=unclassified Pseudonocardia TaxID=2619320 RepID=UPI0003007BCD|nr:MULTISPECIES: hypothetical protein [unclassified Pseudonocardia]KAA1027974.1 hypothetical protein FVA95_13460 [Pseudonocardia sp. EV170527-09]OLL98163.1 hypothetical protein Ae331Ps2_1830c [Pseudonocardia sp. Ae331_Ps2]OLM04129.1 hypothetical protein Ae406Ps2_4129 [Pseudonocardia sp. Ae406_Ps2]OLM11043.1 hypothetical protein Ae505Ps2_1166c [Pseudonocardia sp. Ae505_Ps2]OLM25680.1 hypothetical protein Ae706Ps2_4113 [Pseudonocardia sp. Ae706_Ps2]
MDKRRIAGLAAAAVAAPLLMLGLTGTASAAEITPIAEVVDSTVADLSSTLGAVLDALGLAA